MRWSVYITKRGFRRYDSEMENPKDFQRTYRVNKQVLGSGQGVKREIVPLLEFSKEEYHHWGKSELRLCAGGQQE